MQPQTGGREHAVVITLRGRPGGSAEALRALELELVRPPEMALHCNDEDRVASAPACVLTGSTRWVRSDAGKASVPERTARARLIARTEPSPFAESTFAAERARIERTIEGHRSSMAARHDRLSADMAEMQQGMDRRRAQVTSVASTLIGRGLREFRRYIDANLRGAAPQTASELADTFDDVCSSIETTLNPPANE